MITNRKYFESVLDYCVKRTILPEKQKNIILENYTPKNENAPIERFENVILYAYRAEIIGLYARAMIIHLLDFKEYLKTIL